jgi:DNA helicase-2/ATP-dependent DNA helicase PcrA
MVEERLKLEPEVQEIFRCIDCDQNFLLSGGAGSGKTYSLVQTIRQFLMEKPSSEISCITYTNAAVREISDRIRHPSLKVSTIHDFLWDVMRHYKKEILTTLISLLNDPLIGSVKIEGLDHVGADFLSNKPEGVQYKEYLRLSEGIISHDEILLLAERMFRNYPKLCSILKSKAKLILVDEYQDTSPAVITILLDHLPQGHGNSVVGFFGDAMQAIFDDRIGILAAYKGIGVGKVEEIKKTQNRRNPSSVIELANRLRTDNLVQVPSGDASAPNMLSDGQVRPGQILFLHSSNGDVDRIRGFLRAEQGWDFEDARRTKELNLTHNLIADKAGFRGLMDIYDKDRIMQLKSDVRKRIKETGTVIPPDATFGDVIDLLRIEIKPALVLGQFIAANAELYAKARAYRYEDFRSVYIDKDQLLDDKKQNPEDQSRKGSKRDALIAHLYRIEEMVRLYQAGEHNEFLRKIDFRITSIGTKRILADSIGALAAGGFTTIEQAIVEADRIGICLIDDKLKRFRRESEYIYDRVKSVPYLELRKVYDYVQGYTPFSTQHKTKGAEFDDVFVILDNGRWNDYNFTNLFAGGGSTEALVRTQKIFYVCCTRAKKNLAVFFHQPKPAVVAKAREWFGDDNVKSI